MTTLSLENEIVGSRYDRARGVCIYTIERRGKRWHVEIRLADLDAHGKAPGHLQKRQRHVAAIAQKTMAGPHDEELVGTQWRRAE